MTDAVELIFHADYEKNSTVRDERIYKVVERKFNFLKAKGLSYPSLNAKKLHNETHEGADLWEFYITKKYRCLFTYNENTKIVTVIKICNHL
jgi:mRNA-degrading endonuclease RelE of RelBE toxin-antitoxin system